MQVASFVPTERVFVEELAPARTYGFLKDLELLRQQGLALGGSLDNAVVLGQERRELTLGGPEAPVTVFADRSW